MAIFFLLFAVGFTSRSFFSEVNDGMIDRIAAAPVRPTALLFGKALSVFAYGIASLTTVLVVHVGVLRSATGATPWRWRCSRSP